MNPSALRDADKFFKTYVPYKNQANPRLVDIGSQDVNGTIKQVCPKHIEYVGVDFVPGKGVDIVLEDPYRFPFEDGSFDLVVSSSCFEHSEMFWLTFLEMLRISKDDGLIYINAPSNAAYHRYPVDCWRFYPDCGYALVNWGKRNGYKCDLLESYVADQGDDGLVNDFVAIIVKDKAQAKMYPERIVNKYTDYHNGHSNLGSEILRLEWETEDHRNLLHMRVRTFRRKIKKMVKRFLGLSIDNK